MPPRIGTLALTLAFVPVVLDHDPLSAARGAPEPGHAREATTARAATSPMLQRRSARRSVSPVPGAAAKRRRRPAGFQVARLRGAVTLRTRPGGRVLARVGAQTEFGSPRVLGVAARRGRWLGVVTTARSNNRLAWVDRRDRALRVGRVRYAVHADLSSRTVELRRGGRVLRRVQATIGRPQSPTPTGRFAVTDKLSGPRFSPYYGCCILALSGYQPKPPAGWRGGNRMALHGTSAPAMIGKAASAGCLRASDHDLRPLMARVPLGTPVFIRA